MDIIPVPPPGYRKRRRGLTLATVALTIEIVFTFIFYLSFAERALIIVPASATEGVPELIAYQGLLTDTSGNPLGGAGSVYCFRYSIWDSPSGGSQLWPGGTPGNSTTTVTDGVFSDEIGRVDDLSALDFESTSTYYLQVQVSTSTLDCSSGLETLSPRQQITSDAWSQTAQSVYGDQLRTFSANNVVQIGTGGGEAAGSQTLLSLDVVNVGGSEAVGDSCSQNGTLWYDSVLKQTLVCQNLTIQDVSAPSSSLSFNFYTPTTTAGYNFASKYTTTQKSIAMINCGEAASGATSTLEVGYATTAADGLTGAIDQVVLPSITCGNGGSSVTSFTTSTVPAGDYLIVVVSSTSGDPVHTTLSVAAMRE